MCYSFRMCKNIVDVVQLRSTQSSAVSAHARSLVQFHTCPRLHLQQNQQFSQDFFHSWPVKLVLCSRNLALSIIFYSAQCPCVLKYRFLGIECVLKLIILRLLITFPIAAIISIFWTTIDFVYVVDKPNIE